MAGHAAYLIRTVRKLIRSRSRAAPVCAVLENRLRSGGFFVVVLISRCNAVLNLNDFPFLTFLHHRTLEQFALTNDKTGCTKRSSFVDLVAAVRSAESGCLHIRDSSEFLGYAAMAIFAGNFNGSATVAIDLSVAVCILIKVAGHAVHSLFKVYILQVHRFLP